MGSITVNARKNVTAIITTIAVNIPDYNEAMTKTGGSTFYADQYGKRYISNRLTKSSPVTSVIDLQTKSPLITPRYMTDEEILRTLKEEIYPKVFENSPLSLQLAKDSLDQRFQAHTLEADNMWSELGTLENEYTSLEDNSFANVNTNIDHFQLHEILLPDPNTDPNPGITIGNGNNPGSGNPGNPGTTTTTKPEYVLTVMSSGKVAWLKEGDEYFKSLILDGYCGPWVVAHIISSMTDKKRSPFYYDKYGYTYQGGGDLRGAMTAPCMNNALKDSTNNRVGLRLGGCGRLKAYKHIRQGHFATRLFISWAGKYTAWHWTTLYGSYRIKRFLSTNYYYLQADNGAVIYPVNRTDRNPANAGSYEIIQWFDTLFEVYN